MLSKNKKNSLKEFGSLGCMSVVLEYINTNTSVGFILITKVEKSCINSLKFFQFVIYSLPVNSLTLPGL